MGWAHDLQCQASRTSIGPTALNQKKWRGDSKISILRHLFYLVFGLAYGWGNIYIYSWTGQFYNILTFGPLCVLLGQLKFSEGQLELVRQVARWKTKCLKVLLMNSVQVLKKTASSKLIQRRIIMQRLQLTAANTSRRNKVVLYSQVPL